LEEAEVVDLWPDAEVGEMISDGTVLSFEAETAITKGKCVYLTADMKVSQAASAQNCIGIALKSVEVGESCPVCVRGVVKITASGAITRGQAVYGSDIDGDPLALSDQAVDEGGTAKYTIYYSRRIGFALQTFADNDTGLIMVQK
jgi:hypothetical protein